MFNRATLVVLVVALAAGLGLWASQRYFGAAKHFIGHAADQQACEPTAPRCRHGDQIDIVLSGIFHDGRRDLLGDHHSRPHLHIS